MARLLIPVMIVLCGMTWRLYELLDFGRTVYNHRPGACRLVPGIDKGSEDVDLVREEGIAFVTSGVVFMQPHRAHVKGKIFLYDFNQKLGGGAPKAKELPIKGASFDQNNFHPHGLTHWIVNGVIRLYVINHSNDFKHSVEHKKSIKSPLFVRPNDLVAVGPDQFLLNNDGVAQTELGNVIEILTFYRGGSVVLWDGKEAHTVLSGMGGPNGAAFDAKNNKIFISEVNKRKVNVYDISKDKKTLTQVSSFDLYTVCDNLSMDNDGSVYCGCHPKINEAAVALNDCDGVSTSASQVLHMRFGEDFKTIAVSEPYANDGKELSGSSIAVVHNNQILIGSVCRGLLHCTIDDPSVL
ncbi:hypothetical protein PRIPAC_82141 [Pristionchus pacificus]|uniref:Paraoxonase n=1 Tax=Pristionchus pacificus TaxID=54126 RepID=A0A2A6BXH4_PRIPA|nr:hypothetical protein PRIPAC_82141 [Pristionchus pacificus]|eukprot:PDM70537.1 hypothetical protein PRIPAC_46783 [Pristionchus pacificus]